MTEKQLGFWGDFAFQALKSLTYRELDIAMNGPLAGEMVTAVRVAGVRQGGGEVQFPRPPPDPPADPVQHPDPRALPRTDRLAASFDDPSRLVQRNLQQLLQEQNCRAANPPVQPPASETVP
ncbi:intermembrane phospholipid transport protein YdbH family protein [Sphingomonas sp. MMS24-JH45]